MVWRKAMRQEEWRKGNLMQMMRNIRPSPMTRAKSSLGYSLLKYYFLRSSVGLNFLTSMLGLSIFYHFEKSYSTLLIHSTRVCARFEIFEFGPSLMGFFIFRVGPRFQRPWRRPAHWANFIILFIIYSIMGGLSQA